MSNCDIDLILQLTNIFETTNQSISIRDIAGIIQFTTGTGSAQEVIEEYTAINHPNEFTTMNSTLDAIKKNYLQTKDLNGDVNGLEGFCSAWDLASKQPSFQQCQIQVLARRYWFPAFDFSQTIGMKLSVSIGQIYDSSVQLGLEGTKDLVKRTGRLPESIAANAELKWFLETRKQKLEEMGGAYGPTITRVKSYQYVMVNNPPSWNQSISVLNNDGKVVTLTCNSKFQLPNMTKQLDPIKPFDPNEISRDVALIPHMYLLFNMYLILILIG
ncbi:hypothetical protein BC833DRAFT_645858 [Globomyces pollinis-pini]|nr:hypothetical protein BC833DRAFT_645858 [Globomyces pollinis-pini]